MIDRLRSDNLIAELKGKLAYTEYAANSLDFNEDSREVRRLPLDHPIADKHFLPNGRLATDVNKRAIGQLDDGPVSGYRKHLAHKKRRVG